MTLIDTPSLVHLLRRKGNLVVKQRVASILQSGEAAICEMVAIELWMGVGSRQDERDVEEFCSLIWFLPITEAVWTRA
jgi:predicted nucleic acid-binding protein